MNVGMPIVDFFLDAEASPMTLCVDHDTDGDQEVEVVLGTFWSKADAMSAVDMARQCLQDRQMRWTSVAEALNFAQTEVLHCRGNLGLPEVGVPAGVDSRQDPPLDQVIEVRGQDDVAGRVIASTSFAEQRKRAHRVTLSDQQVRSLLRHLIEAPGYRIDQPTAAIALGVPITQLSGALPMVQRLLNVDQYPVVGRDTDGITIRLDMHLVEEQFGVQR